MAHLTNSIKEGLWIVRIKQIYIKIFNFLKSTKKIDKSANIFVLLCDSLRKENTTGRATVRSWNR